MRISLISATDLEGSRQPVPVSIGDILGLPFDTNFIACYLVLIPRKARLDALGALHHIIVRGIERRAIFRDDSDCDDFLERLRGILGESHAHCFAWSLMSNHCLLLLRSG
jgi:hypothetical protein